jgi:AcrR family transcriptional regulator
MAGTSPSSTGAAPPRNAREEILDAAAALLGESGEAGLTIRRLALRSGYTSPAIYQEFGDKAGLLDAILARAIQALDGRLSRLSVPDDPREAMRVHFQEIVRFGREHPTHYRLMEALQPDQAPPTTSVEAMQQKVESPLALVARDEDHAELMRQALWSLLHGLILLPPSRPDVVWRDDLDRVALEAMLTGLLGSEGSSGTEG